MYVCVIGCVIRTGIVGMTTIIILSPGFPVDIQEVGEESNNKLNKDIDSCELFFAKMNNEP